MPPERAWDALTNPRLLGDVVMGHVEIDPRPGQPFAWQWDIWSKVAPGRHSATWKGAVLDAVPGSTLVLSGGGTTAVLTVKGQGGSSLVTVSHVNNPAGGSIEDYRYGWADFLLKLKTLLEPPVIPDSIYVRTLIRGTSAAILRAWLSPAAMSKILPGKVTLKAKLGGRYEWRWKRPAGRVSTGTFLEIAQGKRVAFTWETEPRPSEVRFEAMTTPYGALVSLEHLGARGNRRDTERMWAHLLERMRVYFYHGRKIRTS